jgi:hypothetical protein
MLFVYPCDELIFINLELVMKLATSSPPPSNCPVETWCTNSDKGVALLLFIMFNLQHMAIEMPILCCGQSTIEFKSLLQDIVFWFGWKRCRFNGTFSFSSVKDKEIKIHLLLRLVYRHVHNCEKQLVASSCLFVCPHGTTQLLLDKFSWNFIFEYFSKICQQIQVS